MQRLDRTLADHEVRQAVEFPIAEMVWFGAKEAVVGDLADLDGQAGLGPCGIEGFIEQAAQCA